MNARVAQLLQRAWPTAEQVGQRWGVAATQVDEERRQQRLLGVWDPALAAYRYPPFQFDEQGQPRPHVATLTALLNQWVRPSTPEQESWNMASWLFQPFHSLSRASVTFHQTSHPELRASPEEALAFLDQVLANQSPEDRAARTPESAFSEHPNAVLTRVARAIWEIQPSDQPLSLTDLAVVDHLPLAHQLEDLRSQFWAHAQHTQAGEAATFEDFLTEDTAPFTRENLAGHYTGSAWLVSADGERVLLTHHKKLQRWLQLGGHADGDVCLARVALREAEEESGLTGLRVFKPIFDVDRHRIPARGEEPEHWHYDVRFVVQAADEHFQVSDESHALAWRSIQEVADDPTLEDALRRMARQWLAR